MRSTHAHLNPDFERFAEIRWRMFDNIFRDELFIVRWSFCHDFRTATGNGSEMDVGNGLDYRGDDWPVSIIIW